MSFQEMSLDENIVHAAQRLRYVDPTPIQEQAIPIILSGRDLIASAQTGTGKTAAFALPILSKLKRHGACRCLILEPTRELAAQVAEALTEFGAFTNLRHTLLHGGVKYTRQKEELEAGVDIIAATPGRLLDLMQMGAVDLSQVEVLVLDEADRMLDMGFMPDVRRIIEQCPQKRQTLLFSATIPPVIGGLISWAMTDPQTVSIGISRKVADTVQHALYPVANDQKFDLLKALLEATHYESVIVFTRTKSDADMIHSALTEAGHSAEVIHADRSQSERTRALERFKTKEVEVLVATNIASRGLDIADVSHVMNYDVPDTPDEYVHRIGRTGRAEKTGDAMTLFTAAETNNVMAVEYVIGQTIERKNLEGFPYRYSALLESVGAPTPASKPVRSLRQSSRSSRR